MTPPPSAGGARPFYSRAHDTRTGVAAGAAARAAALSLRCAQTLAVRRSCSVASRKPCTPCSYTLLQSVCSFCVLLRGSEHGERAVPPGVQSLARLCLYLST